MKSITVNNNSTAMSNHKKEIQKMHVAANPHALFRYKPELAEQASSKEKTTKSSCCIL